MRSSMWGSAAAALIVMAAGAAGAQVRDENPDAERVATTPLRDLNVQKEGIPPVLEAAALNPYATEGLSDCAFLVAAVRELDDVLGSDFDIERDKRTGLTAGMVAQSAVGSLIPFRGIIREVSGAAQAERELQIAVLAGTTRRGFLKALGLQRGCSWPARPATVSRAVTLKK